MRIFLSIFFCFLFLPFFAEAQKEDSCCINPEYATMKCIEPEEIYDGPEFLDA